jgi:hypothetical protein
VDGHPKVDPIRIIESKARTLTHRARSMGWAGPPFDVSVLASLAGLQVKGAVRLGSEEAAILMGTAIFTNVDQAVVRQRFSMCHEIVHPFFPDWQNAPHFSWRGTEDPDREVELLCQLGAAELIMPHWCFIEAARALPMTLETAALLADRYWVSFEAAARRLVALSSEPVALVFLEPGYRKSERAAIEMPLLGGFEDVIQNPLPKLRVVRVAATSQSLQKRRVFIPHNKSIPDSSVCYEALAGAGLGLAYARFVRQEVWDVDAVGECIVDAIGFRAATRRANGVVALLSPVSRVSD